MRIKNVKTQEKYLYCDRDERINQIRSEWHKLAQKLYKTDYFTLKCPGDLRRLIFTQTHVKDPQVALA